MFNFYDRLVSDHVVSLAARFHLRQNILVMNLLRTELPYREDTAAMFEAVADLPWAVFLDSGRHHLTQSRYDIIAAEPHTTLVTRGKLTEIRSDAIELSREDPLVLLRRHLEIDPSSHTDVPSTRSHAPSRNPITAGTFSSWNSRIRSSRVSPMCVDPGMGSW